MNRPPMRIAFLHQPNDPYTETRIKYFLSKGHNVFSIVFNKKIKQKPYDGLTIINLPKHFINRIPFVKRYIYAFNIRRITKEKDIDVFYVISALNCLYLWASSAKRNVLELQGSDVIITGKKIPLLKYYYRFFWRFADAITQDSRHAKECSKNFISDKNKINEIIQIGVDFEIFNPNIRKGIVRKKFNLGDRPIIFHSRSLNDKIYDVQTLLETIPKVKQHFPNICYILTGNQHELNYRDLRYIRKNHLDEHLVFCGRVDHDTEIKYYYIDADITVSIPLSDSSPFSVYEAMATKTPTIVTILPWVGETFIPRKDLLTVNVKDPVNLAASIIKLLTKETVLDVNSAYQVVYQKINMINENLKLERLFYSLNKNEIEDYFNLEIKEDYLNKALEVLFSEDKGKGYWNAWENKIIEKLSFDRSWNWKEQDVAKTDVHYGLFAMSNVLLAKDLFNLDTSLYDNKIKSYLTVIYENRNCYTTFDLVYGALLCIILGKKLYDLDNFSISEIEIIFDKTFEKAKKLTNNNYALILISGKYLCEYVSNDIRLNELKKYIDSLLLSFKGNGYFETHDFRASYHQRTMYVLRGLVCSTNFYPEKAKQIRDVFENTIFYIWKNRRGKEDNGLLWHPSFYLVNFKNIFRVPMFNPHSSKYLFECHQTFFANAINFYQIIYHTNRFSEEKNKALEWIFGENRIKKNLVDISGLGIPIRMMDLKGNIFINGQNFKGSYEIGSYILALAGQKYFSKRKEF